ncbi:MAG: class I SAM-dependent methyltransferase [Magnetococcus sp. WYHC-3]
MNEVLLKPGREASLRRRHPWVFSGAIAQVRGQPLPGETVMVRDHSGQPLGRGAWSGNSQIRVRMWTHQPDEEVDPAFFRRRLQAALDLRGALPGRGADTSGRLVHAESDGLPGLVVDRYHRHLVCQLTTTGMDAWREVLFDLLADMLHPEGIFERSDADARRLEGLPERTGVVWGAAPSDYLVLEERGLEYLVDVRVGHKTGFYLDQRDNRAVVAAWAAGRETLNVFCYTGAFGIAACAGGAAGLVQLDSSAPSLALAQRHAEINGLDGIPMAYERADAFEQLRRYQRAGRRFDLIILDPPRLVESQSQLERAARAYKDINRLGFLLLNPGGVLATFSCSGRLEEALFQKIVADAALDAGREAQILQRLSQGPDHPVPLWFPEGAYLKGLLCRVQ